MAMAATSRPTQTAFNAGTSRPPALRPHTVSSKCLSGKGKKYKYVAFQLDNPSKSNCRSIRTHPCLLVMESHGVQMWFKSKQPGENFRIFSPRNGFMKRNKQIIFKTSMKKNGHASTGWLQKRMVAITLVRIALQMN